MNNLNNLKPGDKIAIELIDDEQFLIGDLYKIGKEFKRIQLINVYDFKTKQSRNGVQIFYSSEIRSIRRCDGSGGGGGGGGGDDEDNLKNATTTISTESDQNHQQSNQTTTADNRNNTNTIPKSIDELNEINNCIKNYKFIAQTDQSYHIAINTIQKQNVIGVSLEGSQLGRLLRSSILTIATHTQIFIFDIAYFGQIFPELKRILESQKIYKIVHNSSYIADHLHHRHGIELNAIFDTMVAHISLLDKKSASQAAAIKSLTLNDCISKYLNVSKSFLLAQPENPKIWLERPLTNELKLISSQNGKYLLELHACFLNEHFLKCFHQQCTKFSTSLKTKQDSSDVAMNVAYGRNRTINDIEPFQLELNDVEDDHH